MSGTLPCSPYALAMAFRASSIRMGVRLLSARTSRSILSRRPAMQTASS